MKLAGLGKGSGARACLGLTSIWEEGRGLVHLTPLGMAWHQVCQSFRSIATSPLTSLLTILTIALAMCLLASFVLLLENIAASLQSTRRQLSVSLYLAEGIPETKLQGLKQRVADMPQVAEVVFHSKEQALQDFRRVLGQQAGLLEGLEGVNPLPASLEVRLKESSEAAFRAVAEHFRADPLVEEVQYDQGVVGQLGALLETLKVIGLAAAVLVLLMTAFIIASAIKLALYSRREEIEIMRLVGATDPFVRAPYVIEGCIQGAVGSLAGLAVVYGIFTLLQNFVQSSPVFRLVLPSLAFLSWSSMLLVLLLGVAVGIGGSYFALKRFYFD